MAKRYKVTKEQVEKIVEGFVMEAAAPEAKKHIQGSVSDEKVGHSVKTGDGRTGKKQAPEAKKHVQGSTGGSKQVEERPNTPNAGEVDPGTKEDEQSHAPEAKKHVKGSVAEGTKRQVVITEGIVGKLMDKIKGALAKVMDDPKVQAAYQKAQAELGKLSGSEKQEIESTLQQIEESIVHKNGKNVISESKLQTIAGLATAGGAFATAVGVMVKAAIGAGLYTYGLPVGVIVAICMGILAIGGGIGSAGYEKMKKNK
jgi:hypothetical protein